MSKVVLKVKISQMMPSSYRIKEEILVVLQLVLHFFLIFLHLEEKQDKWQKLFDRGLSVWGVEIARLHAQVRQSALRFSDFILQGSPIPEFAFTPQPSLF